MMTKHTMYYLPLVCLLLGTLGCGGGGDSSTVQPPAPQGNKRSAANDDANNGSRRPSPSEGDRPTKQAPVDQDRQGSSPSNGPASGPQNSVTPPTPSSSPQPGVGGVSSQPTSRDQILQHASDVVAQVKLTLQQVPARPEVLSIFENVEYGLMDAKNNKDDSRSFETKKDFFCIQANIFSMSVMIDSTMPQTTRDAINTLMDSLEKPGELCHIEA